MYGDMVVNEKNDYTVFVRDASCKQHRLWARYPLMVDMAVQACAQRVRHGLAGSLTIDDVDDKYVYFSNATGTMYFVRYFLGSVSQRGYMGSWTLYSIDKDGNSLELSAGERYFEYNWAALCGVTEEEYKRIERFARATGSMINGLDKGLLAMLIARKVVVDGPDLFTLTVDKMACVGLSPGEGQTLIDSIDNRKSMSLARFLWILGVDEIGWQVAKSMSEHFQSLDALRSANTEMIASVPGMTVDQAATVAIRLRENVETIEKLLNAGVKIATEPFAAPANYFSGLTFRFQGKLTSFRCKQAWEIIMNSGGNVVNSSQRTIDYLVVPRKRDGDDKYFTITEDDYLLMLHDSHWHNIANSRLDDALNEVLEPLESI